MSLRDRVAAKNDIPTVTIQVPTWDNEPVLFKGMTFQEFFDFQQTHELSDSDTPEQVSDTTIALIQVTAYDPDDGTLAFNDDAGALILRARGSAAILFMITNGVNKVLGVGTEPGKDSSSTETDSQTPAA